MRGHTEDNSGFCRNRLDMNWRLFRLRSDVAACSYNEIWVRRAVGVLQIEPPEIHCCLRQRSAIQRACRDWERTVAMTRCLMLSLLPSFDKTTLAKMVEIPLVLPKSCAHD